MKIDAPTYREEPQQEEMILKIIPDADEQTERKLEVTDMLREALKGMEMDNVVRWLEVNRDEIARRRKHVLDELNERYRISSPDMIQEELEMLDRHRGTAEGLVKQVVWQIQEQIRLIEEDALPFDSDKISLLDKYDDMTSEMNALNDKIAAVKGGDIDLTSAIFEQLMRNRRVSAALKKRGAIMET